ncbi:unnamed protein product [Adineta ricciae]|nr:unnamed protein product [Adineta ricciae]
MVLLSIVSIPAGIVLLATGGALFGISTFAIVCVGIWTFTARFGRMKQAIAAESMKYASRQPVPTRWELDSVTVRSYASDDGPTSSTTFFLKIHIGAPTQPVHREDPLRSNWDIYEPVSYIP